MSEFSKSPVAPAKKTAEKKETFCSTVQKLREGKSLSLAKSPASVSISGKKKSVK